MDKTPKVDYITVHLEMKGAAFCNASSSSPHCPLLHWKNISLPSQSRWPYATLLILAPHEMAPLHNSWFFSSITTQLRMTLSTPRHGCSLCGSSLPVLNMQLWGRLGFAFSEMMAVLGLHPSLPPFGNLTVMTKKFSRPMLLLLLLLSEKEENYM